MSQSRFYGFRVGLPTSYLCTSLYLPICIYLFIYLFIHLFIILNNERKKPWKHPFQESVCLFLLLDQLTGSFHDQFLQIIRILLHHVDYVIKDVGFPLERNNRKEVLKSLTISQTLELSLLNGTGSN